MIDFAATRFLAPAWAQDYLDNDRKNHKRNEGTKDNIQFFGHPCDVELLWENQLLQIINHRQDNDESQLTSALSRSWVELSSVLLHL